MIKFSREEGSAAVEWALFLMLIILAVFIGIQIKETEGPLMPIPPSLIIKNLLAFLE